MRLSSQAESALKIFAAWFLSGGVIGVSLLYLLRPLAGLFFLLGVTTLLSMTVAPVAHIVLRRKGVGTAEIIRTLLLGLAVCLFLLAFTGWFNFT